MMATKQVNIKGIPLYDHQKAVLALVEQHPTGATIVVKAPRQRGKTLMVSQLLLKLALEKPHSNSVLVEPTSAGCRRVMKDLVKMLNSTPLVQSANFQYLDLELANGSIIQFRSGESKDGLRGISLKPDSLLVIDEGAFISDDVYGIVFPFANVHNNTKLVISTPLFKQGSFYEHYELAVKGELNHFLVDFNDYDTSMMITDEQLAEARKTMSYQKYLNEYMGEFMEERGNVFGDFSKCVSNNFNRSISTCYMGIDWSNGLDKDNTAIAIFNNNKEQVRLVYFNDKDIDATITEIVKLIREYKPSKVTVESNSIGEVHYQLLNKRLASERISQRVVKFTTTNDSKRRIIENMVVMIQNGEVQFLDDIEMKLELATYEVENTKSGRGITYNAKAGSKDDCIMASAICLDSMSRGSYIIA